MSHQSSDFFTLRTTDNEASKSSSSAEAALMEASRNAGITTARLSAAGLALREQAQQTKSHLGFEQYLRETSLSSSDADLAKKVVEAGKLSEESARLLVHKLDKRLISQSLYQDSIAGAFELRTGKQKDRFEEVLYYAGANGLRQRNMTGHVSHENSPSREEGRGSTDDDQRSEEKRTTAREPHGSQEG